MLYLCSLFSSSVIVLVSLTLYPQSHAVNSLAEQFGSSTEVQQNASEFTSFPPRPHLYNIPLQKQYVPISKNGKVIAYKAAYFGQIYAGTPPKPFTVVFDTGSGHFILPSSTCFTGVCRKHKRFDRRASKSAVDIEGDGTVLPPDASERDQVGITFGTGEVLGEFVKDVFCLTEDAGSCVETRMVLAVDMAEEPFGLFNFDGVLGMGLGPLAFKPEFNVISQLVRHMEMKPQFSIFLAPHDGGASVISIGGYDEARALTGIQWAPVADPTLGYWQIPIKRVKMGDTFLQECEDGGCRAIIDSGTSLLGVPRSVLRTMHRVLARPVGKEYQQDVTQLDCRMIPGAQISFELGDNHVVTLGVEDYARPSPFNMTYPDDPRGWELFCRSLLLPADMAKPLSPMTFLFGEPVLRRYYTVFDVERLAIGFARARETLDAAEGLPVIGKPPTGTRISGVGVPLPKAMPIAALV